MRPTRRTADNADFGGNAELPKPAAPENAAAHPVIPAPPVIPAQAGIQHSAHPVILAPDGAGISCARQCRAIVMSPQGGDMTKALKGRNVIAQGKRESAPPCVAATNSLKPCKGDTLDNAAAIAALDSRLRGNDKIPVIPAQAGISGGEGLTFADYVRREQTRLLFALDNALSQKAESAITENFAAVKKAGVQLQTKLGGRKSNIGVNVIGSFAETDNEAFGWHLRGYGGDEDTFGANAGIFYREIDDGMLFGVNAFADYEDGDNGKFSRVGIGGEIKHENAGVVVNYYAPVGGAQKVNSTVAAFSRRGFDAKVRITAPYFNALKAAADYYNFAGKDGIKDEDGLRYGAELNLASGLHLGVFYDDGAEKVGGELSYLHTFNSSPSPSFPQNSSSFLRKQESPDLFAAVSREYSQRIATLATGPGISLQISIVGIVTTAMTTQARTITTTTTIDGMVTVTRMTTPEMVSIMTTETEMVAASRAASVRFTTAVNRGGAFGVVVVSTNFEYLVTLPPADTSRPWVLTLSSFADSTTGAARIVVSPNVPAAVGANVNIVPPGDYVITIVEGSEEIVGESTTTTLTTRTTTTMAAITTATTMTVGGMSTTTTMTILPVSTTTRITTFATTTITLGATSAAMGEMPPLSSSFPFSSSFLRKQESPQNQAAHAQKEIPAVAGMTGGAGMTGFYTPRLQSKGGCEFAKGKVAGGAFGICRSPKAQRPPPESTFALSPPSASRRGG